MSEERICDVCGRKVTQKVTFQSKSWLFPQKIFYVCDSPKCLDRVIAYAHERAELPKIEKIAKR